VKDLIDALRRLLELAAAYIAGFAKAKSDSRADQAETDLAAYRQRKRDEREIAGLSDDDLDRELRDPPK
jgi:hypothetical protein